MRRVLILMLTNPYHTLFDSLGIVMADITGLFIQVYIYLSLSISLFTELFHEVTNFRLYIHHFSLLSGMHV